MFIAWDFREDEVNSLQDSTFGHHKIQVLHWSEPNLEEVFWVAL